MVQPLKQLFRGNTPLLITVPHAGTIVPADIKLRLTEQARVLPDTDWCVDVLYEFAKELGATLLLATHSRYVVDLNRDSKDTDLYPGQLKTGLVPLETFKGEAIYQTNEEPDTIEQINRVAAYWYPFHDAIKAEIDYIKDKFGYCMLYDAHSIASEVPRLFDNILPDLNIGTVHGSSFDEELSNRVMAACANAPFQSVLNSRFVGGYITRHYGDPKNNVHAVQMEQTQKNYLDGEIWPIHYNPDKAAKLQSTLRAILIEMLEWGKTQKTG